MLDLPRYLLGVAEIALLAGLATLGATAIRSRLLPLLTGAPAHLATGVIALALLVWTAEALGSFGLFEPVPYFVGVAVVGIGLRLGVGGWGCPAGLLGFSPGESSAGRGSRRGEKQDAAAPEGHPHPPSSRQGPTEPGSEWTPVDQGDRWVTCVALAIAVLAVAHFAADVRMKLGTGMTGFDSTWYHGPFAAGFFQSGDTWDLHFVAPQFLAWFYPANAETFHAVGMLAFGRDVLSPLLNLGWFAGCLAACWCIGRPYRVAPWSLALGAVALSLPVLSDQAGEARNDIVGIFFLLAAVAIALNAWVDGEIDRREEAAAGLSGKEQDARSHSLEPGPLLVSGLAAGLAAGTKLNFVLPAAVLVLGLAFVVPSGARLRAFVGAGLAALAGGGYWYLRNLIHTGNPLPWFDGLGPTSLPAPDQALGGREGHSVLGYLTDGTVWSDWFLSGLHGGLTILWPLLAGVALAGLLLSAVPLRQRREGRDRVLIVAGATGLAVILTWLIAPTSASGPEGTPRGFESGLRYLAPAVVLGLAFLPEAPHLRDRLRRLSSTRLHLGAHSRAKRSLVPRMGPAGASVLLAVLALAIGIGYPVQRHYLENRYANPTFAAPGLNAAFAWARGIDHARIATTSTRQYPLYGTDLSNRVQYIGEEQSQGGFTAPATCPQWRHLLNAGNYDYVITTRDRIEPGKPPYPETARWTKGPSAQVVLRRQPTVVFQLRDPLDPSACP
jgi:hypothetical protein